MYTNNYATLTTTTITVPINPADIIPGTNVLKAYVCDIAKTFRLIVCGSIKQIIYLMCSTPTIVTTPLIAESSGCCYSSSATNNIANYYWEMAECDAAGKCNTGGYLWSGWYAGVPSGNFFNSQ